MRINGQLVAEYRYNSLGQRVAKLTDQGFTTYLYGPDGQLLGESEYDATGSRQRSQSYLWLDSLPLASVQAQGSAPAKVLYLHSDHLNTPRLATSAGQQIVWQWQSDAFGNGTANQDPQGSGQPTVLNLRFPGQYFDAESGLHYNYFRDYDPQTGRYVESDPIGLIGGVNSYGYADGNPISRMDSFGLWSSTIGGYYGPGVEFVVGNDSGNSFITIRIGLGIGGGIQYDPNGGLPGSEPENRCESGKILSTSGQLNFTAGPFGAGLEGGAARNYTDQKSSLYFSPNISVGTGGWGLGAAGSIGGQYTVYGPRVDGGKR